MAALARLTRIAPRDLLGLTAEEYRDASFIGLDGQAYGLADDVLGHLIAGALAEQREHEKQTGKRASIGRRRPDSKKGSGEHA